MISAVSLNGVIGRANDLPWGRNYPEDMFFFRKMTLDQTIIMGRETWVSMGSKGLPKRKNILVSSKLKEVSQISDGITTGYPSYEMAFNAFPDAWVIGGSSAYQAGLAVADEIFITTIPLTITGERLVYFPYVNPFQFSVKETIMIGEKLVCTVYKRAT
jgi:dihydrofolate reductase